MPEPTRRTVFDPADADVNAYQLLTALVVPLTWCGLAIARPAHVEDELGLTAPAS